MCHSTPHEAQTGPRESEGFMGPRRPRGPRRSAGCSVEYLGGRRGPEVLEVPEVLELARPVMDPGGLGGREGDDDAMYEEWQFWDGELSARSRQAALC
jgi:hypothetical protein